MNLNRCAPVVLFGTGSCSDRGFDKQRPRKMVETSDQWIGKNGIRERHIASEGELTSDFAPRRR